MIVVLLLLLLLLLRATGVPGCLTSDTCSRAPTCGHTSIVYFNFSIYFGTDNTDNTDTNNKKHLPPPTPPTNCQNSPLWSLLAQPVPSTKNTEKTQSPFPDLPCPTTGTLCQDLDGPTPFEKECLDPRPPRDCLSFVFGCNVDFGHVGNPTIA
jgi:hypothetical protein